MTQSVEVSGPKQLSVASGLVMENVSKSFTGVQALSNVSFEVRPGEIHGLVGENGAGKSTMMAIASGALAPDAGSVLINGDRLRVADPERARGLGLAIVRQEPALMPDLTVAENMFLGVQSVHQPKSSNIRGWAGQQLRSWDEAILIEPGARVASLVPEEKFIVEISKALAQEPTVLLLDEPTEHLSTDDVQRLFGKIRELKAAGCAIVYISHRINEVRQIADRITVLRDGESQGTYAASSLDEAQIVTLIVGRPLESAFPDKPPSSDSAPKILQVEALSGKGFNDVSLTIRQGEIVGLAGIEGNGQRDFLRALAGLNRSRGTVKIGTEAVSIRTPPKAIRARVAYVPGDRHHEGILDSLSVRENFAMRTLGSYAAVGALNRRAEEAAVGKAISSFRIKTPTMETPIASLSGGNQQKVVLASVLASEPRLLLADEPSQGVDVGARGEIYELIRSAAASGTAVLLVSSDAIELAGLCDRVIVFSRGKAVVELKGTDVSEYNITEAVLTATTERVRPKRASKAVRWLAGPYAAPLSVSAAIVALGIWAALGSSYYLTSRNMTGMLALTAALALVACGEQLVLAIGSIDLSVGPLMGSLVVIMSFFLAGTPGVLTQALGWLLLFAVAAGVGVLNWVLIDLVMLPPMVATLATYTGLLGLSLTLRPTPGGVFPASLTEGINMNLGPVPIMFIVAVVIVMGLEVLLFRTRTGIALRGVGSRPEAARVAGIVPRRVHLIAYVGCSLFAALAAIPLMAQVGSGDPSAGVGYTLTSIVAVVVGGASVFGGRASFVGTLLGSLLIVQIGVVTTFLTLDASWNFYMLGGATLIAVAAYSRSRELVVPR